MNITNDVLAEKIDGLSTRFADTQKVIGTLVSNDVFQLRLKELDVAIKRVDIEQQSNKIEIEKLKNRRYVPTLVIASVASTLTAAFTYLLISRLR